MIMRVPLIMLSAELSLDQISIAYGMSVYGCAIMLMKCNECYKMEIEMTRAVI